MKSLIKMKQTVEEAAHLFAETRSSGSTFPAYYHGFMAGAEWQSRHSPWISVEDELPPKTKDVLVVEVRGNYHNFGIAWCDNNPNGTTQWYSEDENLGKEFIRYWMPIPSFKDILEANKDVLQRMKEKGD